METNIRPVKINNRPDYLFNENMIVNIKDFDSSLLEINKLSFKGVFSVSIYYIKYIPTKSPNLVSVYRTDNDEDFLHLLLDDVDGHTEENDGIQYLVFASTDKNKEALKNYTKLWQGTKKQIEVTNDDEPIEYRKDFMKIKFESGDDLPLRKTFNILDMIIVVASVLEKSGKYYPQISVHECAYNLSHVRMLQYEKIDVSEGIDTNKTSASKECMLCHYWCFKDVGFKFEPHVCNRCHDVLMTAYELKNIAILNVKEVDFRCSLWGISRDEAVNRLNNSVIEDKGVL